MDDVIAACRSALATERSIVVLTGAGISAESGIPTFRGKDGYWKIGSRTYHPQELATHAAFQRMPWDVWAWYLYRRGVCRAARPNAAHTALVRLGRGFGERVVREGSSMATSTAGYFTLVTQNVDGLHRRAGSPAACTFAIHGDIDRMRCAAACSAETWAIPESVPALAQGAAVAAATRAQLACPRCRWPARPHVLWFDEAYDEPLYHRDTVRALAARAALVIVVGTSAQTNLPWQVVTLAVRAGATIVDVNVEDNPFGDIARESGGCVREPAAVALPRLVDALIS